jgi:hypothetical protein
MYSLRALTTGCVFLDHARVLASRRRADPRNGFVKKSMAPASILEQGCAGFPPGSPNRCDQFTRHPGRTSPPLRPRLSFRYTQVSFDPEGRCGRIFVRRKSRRRRSSEGGRGIYCYKANVALRLGLISLGGPVSRAPRLPRVAAPSAATGIACELARARGKFVLNGHGRSNGTGTRHIAAKLHEVWVRDDTVSDVDGEIIGRVARASLCHESEVPRPVVGRARFCSRGQDKAACERCEKQEILHHHSSEALLALPWSCGEGQGCSCSKLLYLFSNVTAVGVETVRTRASRMGV